MSTFLPKELEEGLQEARKYRARKASRLRVEADGKSFPVLKRWENGFSVDAEVVPPLRGNVELFEGSRFLSTCLIIASAEEGGQMRYEYKRSTPARDAAPLDFQKDADAPVALLGRATD
ncbi:hypothetical protein SAMN06297129_1073 [Pseudooceanicola antarcticus]|uniref:Uncharacterized protein n=1 Tax=Pseudooceanicola antarcticus TaxID=1247613 RepID=A0A285IIQ0_9RHOB|nr:hypothetical protein [Pseudooceanicola antarcticus]PJE29057.1 hypothetical protein CVM39_11475 [Pseudooceanicola antarcticus]SNY46956.1 hypothetical protein SAMN06297129_1073 [Pseudooceanicola antarcticus]